MCTGEMKILPHVSMLLSCPLPPRLAVSPPFAFFLLTLTYTGVLVVKVLTICTCLTAIMKAIRQCCLDNLTYPLPLSVFLAN